MALGLCGSQQAGNAAVKLIVRKSLHALPWCDSDAEPANWFAHHTILTCREMSAAMPAATEDVLARVITSPPPEHIAFVKALRGLPRQQMEAFLLMRCEHVDARGAAVAMDCSTQAVATHHVAATKALSEIAGNEFEARTAELMRAYASLSPTEQLVEQNVNIAGRKMRRTRFWRFIKNLILLALLAGVAWVGWRLWKMIII